MAEWWRRGDPSMVMEHPWLAPKVVEHLESLLRPSWHVLEHGSGGSTIWFAERVKTVTSIEANIKWMESVSKIVPDNVTMAANRLAITPGKYNLLLIDGEPVTDRIGYIIKAAEIVKPGGWVVLDNANRPEYALERTELQTVAATYQTFDCNEDDTHYLVTEFYRMPK